MRGVILGLALVACTPTRPTLVLDAETVAERMQRVEDDVPSCHTAAGATTARRLRVDTASAHRLGAFFSAVRSVAHGPEAYAGVGTTGSCGGSLDVSFEHGDGTTVYEAVMSSFCIPGEEGEVTYDGVFAGRENGRPSPTGPVIRSVDYETRGPVSMTQGDDEVEVELRGARTTYANPAPWAPDPPTEEQPDVTTVDDATAHFLGPDRVDEVKGLRVEKWGESSASVRITGGAVATRGEPGVVLIRTPGEDVVTLDLEQGTVAEGTVVFEGAGDTKVEVVVRPEQPGVVDVMRDGVMVGPVDCTSGNDPRGATIAALLAALPVH